MKKQAQIIFVVIVIIAMTHLESVSGWVKNGRKRDNDTKASHHREQAIMKTIKNVKKAIILADEISRSNEVKHWKEYTTEMGSTVKDMAKEEEYFVNPFQLNIL